jgi:hypothetical protein
MSLIGRPFPVATAGGFDVPNAIHFSAASTQYMSRAISSTSNRRTFTISLWHKRGKLSQQNQRDRLFATNGAVTDAGYFAILYNDTTGTLTVQGGATEWKRTTETFSDPASFHNLVISVDTTNATTADRIKIYKNGARITAFAVDTGPSLNYDLGVNLSGATNYFSESPAGGGPTSVKAIDGNIAEYCLIDGTALDETSFGEFDETVSGVQLMFLA